MTEKATLENFRIILIRESDSTIASIISCDRQIETITQPDIKLYFLFRKITIVVLGFRRVFFSIFHVV